jgi:GH18 family chitinase
MELFVVVFLLSITGCAMNPQTTPSPTAGPTATVTPASEPFRVIAYVTDAIVPSVVPYDKLTHINFAFLIPNADGTFRPLMNGWKVEEIVRLAHGSGVKVLMSVGGWGWDAQFETVAADSTLRSEFVRNLMAVVTQYNLDGVDMDWEYPDAGPSADNFLALMQEIRTALPGGKLLTAAVPAAGEHAEAIPAETFALVDFLNLMVYDGGGDMHSSMDYARTSIAFWQDRGLPKKKTVLGVPFYARPTETSYRKLVEDYPEAAQTDVFKYNGTKINYNGIPTMKEKTRLALEQASGIMFWTLEQDATGDLSLLGAIHQVVYGGTP